MAEVKVTGTFDTQRFFETLALILSKKFNCKVTVKVSQKEKGEELAETDRRAAG